MLCHRGCARTLRRYLAEAVLRTAAAQISATARLGSAWPGKVAHPVFITNSVCSYDEVMALSTPSFMARAIPAFCPERQLGTSAAVTAASAWVIPIWRAVVPVVQPPQLKPTIMVRMLPSTAPQIPGLSDARSASMRCLLALRKVCEGPSVERRSLSRIVDQGPIAEVRRIIAGGPVGRMLDSGPMAI